MRFLKRAVGILAVGAVLAACSTTQKPHELPAPPAQQQTQAPAPAPEPKEDGQLVISTFGFGADLVQKHMIEPFSKQYGIKVTVETGTNADRLNKLRANKANPTVDVVLITDYFAQIAINEGLFDKVNAANIPNLKNLYDFAPNKEGYGPIYTVNRLGLVYRTDKVKTPPTSWKDLWKPEYKGMLALPDLNISYGMPFLGAIAQTYGQNDQDMEATFKALKDVKGNVVKFFGRTSELTSLMQQGEVVIAPAGDIFIISLVKAGQPIQWVVPQEGGYLISNTIQVVKGTKRKNTAETFMNFVLSKEIQEVAAKQWYDAPVNKEAKLDAETAKYLAYGNEAFKNFKTQDQAFVVKNRDAWIDRFMREVAQ